VAEKVIKNIFSHKNCIVQKMLNVLKQV